MRVRVHSICLYSTYAIYVLLTTNIVYHGDGTVASIHIRVLLFDTIFLILLYFSYFLS